MISNGGVFIVDEMSARLHPLLTKLIVDIFCSEQNEKAQLIFTTHNMSTSYIFCSEQNEKAQLIFTTHNMSTS